MVHLEDHYPIVERPVGTVALKSAERPEFGHRITDITSTRDFNIAESFVCRTLCDMLDADQPPMTYYSNTIANHKLGAMVGHTLRQEYLYSAYATVRPFDEERVFSHVPALRNMELAGRRGLILHVAGRVFEQPQASLRFNRGSFELGVAYWRSHASGKRIGRSVVGFLVEGDILRPPKRQEAGRQGDSSPLRPSTGPSPASRPRQLLDR